ncbi:MAG: substrate-binding domain-containing protein [Desulfurococcaceae archaeon]
MKFKILIAIAISVVFALALISTVFKQNYVPMGTVTFRVNVATTTSLYQTGLISDLLEDFRTRLRNQTGINVYFSVIAKGSGEALRLLADGSACIGFTHAPLVEYQYMNQGLIERLTMFAYNEFVIVGPRSDPAKVGEAGDAVDAFTRIYTAGEKGLVKFVSRSDMSGTYTREIQLWKLAGVNPEGRYWYLKSGQGMAQTLLMAESLGAYTLTDKGTYLSLVNQGKLRELTILLEDPSHLLNIYSVYISTSSYCSNPEVYFVALKLKIYLSHEGQELIKNRYSGLFNPIGDKEELLLLMWKNLSKIG